MFQPVLQITFVQNHFIPVHVLQEMLNHRLALLINKLKFRQ